jgi:hypothetical protein
LLWPTTKADPVLGAVKEMPSLAGCGLVVVGFCPDEGVSEDEGGVGSDSPDKDEVEN